MDFQNNYIERKYIVPKDRFTDYLLLSLTIIIFLGLWVFILYLARGYKQIDTNNTSTKNNPQSGNRLKASSNLQANYDYQFCPSGECPTNIFTGEKRCPSDVAQTMLYDPTYEVCNPVKACTSSLTPFAVRFDQSSTTTGLCDAGMDGCRCINYLSTPSFTQILFQVTGGSIYEANPQLVDKWKLSQIPTSSVGQGNNTPIRYSDPINQFYEISPSLLSYVVPSPDICTQVYIKGSEVSDADTLECVNANPCLVGKMAYVLGYRQYFTNFDYYNDINSTSLACVPALMDSMSPFVNSENTGCKLNAAPVFNYINGKIYCVGPPT